MEGLRHSLLAPAGATVLILFGTVDTMKRMIRVKYAAKDDNDKLLFPHPFAPWTSIDDKYAEKSEKVLRAYRMFENVKEWTFMSLPLLWVYALFAGSVPYMSDTLVDVSVIGSSLVFVVGSAMFSHGYIESAEKRLQGFKLRMKATLFWLFGSVVAVGCSALRKYGVF